jgi:bifunctional DNA-binding transcriptional regulator/antitoxin component of YhaV-PrlF toxin-antitoxin module
MVTEMILNPIWKGQITIPQAWRKIIWIDGKKEVKARLEWNRVIIEPIENDIEWDIDLISLDKLNKETRDAIKIADENYKAWRMDKFISHNDFWNV